MLAPCPSEHHDSIGCRNGLKYRDTLRPQISRSLLSRSLPSTVLICLVGVAQVWPQEMVPNPGSAEPGFGSKALFRSLLDMEPDRYRELLGTAENLKDGFLSVLESSQMLMQ